MGLEQLLYLQGVGAEFIDCHGQGVTIPVEDRHGVLECMLDSSSESTPLIADPLAVEGRVVALDATPWTRVLPEFQHSHTDNPSFNLHLPNSFQQGLWVKITTEFGEEYSLELLPERLKVIGDYHFESTDYLLYQVSIKALYPEIELGLGYHQIEVIETEGPVTKSGILLIAPPQAFQLKLQDGECVKQRYWGVSIQLYSLRSDEQWGVGDFGDLSKLIEIIATHGGDFIQLNPLHALDSANPESVSPYSPSDRRRLNPLYIDVVNLEEYQYIASVVTSTDFMAKKQHVNKDNWINYSQTTELKFHILTRLYEAFVRHELQGNTERAQSFFTFIEVQGADLSYFSTAMAQKAPKGASTDPQFFCYLQFVAEAQLEICQAKAKVLGMSIGLIRDLAVGASPDGIEVTQNKQVFCHNASIGAPPDPFAPHGQNWGVTPIDPIKLKRDKYQHFIEIIRRNMRHCGALRMDHIMAILRLWWCPNNPDLGAGAYVYYPLETLLAILCLESHRSECLIIGEDLGVVPPELNGYLKEAGIYSNQLFYFCKHHNGFEQPSDHRPHSLMMLANHDVPTLAAWWSASDMHLLRQLGLLDTNEALGEALSCREQDKEQLINLILQHDVQNQYQHLTELSEWDFESLLPAWIALAAKTRSSLFSVQLCDLVGERHSVNIPGTWKEYANWQRRLPYTLDEIANSPKVKQLFEVILARRG